MSQVVQPIAATPELLASNSASSPEPPPFRRSPSLVTDITVSLFLNFYLSLPPWFGAIGIRAYNYNSGHSVAQEAGEDFIDASRRLTHA